MHKLYAENEVSMPFDNLEGSLDLVHGYKTGLSR